MRISIQAQDWQRCRQLARPCLGSCTFCGGGLREFFNAKDKIHEVFEKILIERNASYGF